MGPLALRLSHHCSGDALAWQQLGASLYLFCYLLRWKGNPNCILLVSDLGYVDLGLVIKQIYNVNKYQLYYYTHVKYENIDERYHGYWHTARNSMFTLQYSKPSLFFSFFFFFFFFSIYLFLSSF